MTRQQRLYLDNAATSFPKPPGVYEAMLHYGTQIGGTSGRGNYREAREGGRLIRRCRERINALIGGESPDHVVFTLNTTDALNLAIKGIVAHRRSTAPDRPVHLVATEMDHNSVLRPFNALAGEGIEWTCVRADPETGIVDPADVGEAIRPGTALVAMVHASNVTGSIQPAAAVGRLCRERGVPFLLDAAQSMGHLPVDVGELSVDLLAFPGHKGMLGPLGTGGLYIRPGMERTLAPLREGGTGSASEIDVQPATLPDKYEPGSHNAVGIAGLSEAVAWLMDRRVESLREHEIELITVVLESLAELESAGLRLLGPKDPSMRVGVFSFVHEELSPGWIADELERRFGVLVRAGIHCAPRAHRALGTLSNGEARAGAVRLSVGPFLKAADVRYACEALRQVCAGVGAAERSAVCKAD